MRVVLIGDSIRLGYQPGVVALLEGTAEVVGPEANCRSTHDILEHFGSWVTGLLEPGCVVHLNAGLHDLRRLEGPGSDPQVAISAYERSLDRIVGAVRADPRCFRLILATTTPVDDERHATGRCTNRHNEDVARYNMRLCAVADRHGVDVHDLNAVIGVDPTRFLDADGVHLSEAGNAVAAASVTEAIISAVPALGG